MAVCEIPVNIRGCPHPQIVAQHRSKYSQYAITLQYFMDSSQDNQSIYIYSLHNNTHTNIHTHARTHLTCIDNLKYSIRKATLLGACID
jgi:hypothetical protein